MIKLRNIVAIASVALLLAGTILSTMGIFTAYSAQTKEKEVHEELVNWKTNQTGEDFNTARNAILNKIFDAINIINSAFALLACGMLFFGLGVTVFTIGSYQGGFIPKSLKKHAEAKPEKREEELTGELAPQPPPAPPALGAITLRCKACKSSFTVEPKARPFKVKCPKCGAEGMI